MHKLTRRAFTRGGVGASAGPLITARTIQAASAQRHRSNILFITTDYQRGAGGPSPGTSFLNMPAPDRLCREGAVSSRHISTSFEYLAVWEAFAKQASDYAHPTNPIRVCRGICCGPLPLRNACCRHL